MENTEQPNSSEQSEARESGQPNFRRTGSIAQDYEYKPTRFERLWEFILNKWYSFFSKRNAPNFEDGERKTPQPEPPPKSSHDNRLWAMLDVKKEEYQALMEFRADYEQRNKFYVFLIGVLFTPVTLAGALMGYIRAYNRFFRGRGWRAYLFPMWPITRVAMIIGAIVFWIATLVVLGFVFLYLKGGNNTVLFIKAYFAITTIGSTIVFGSFTLWQYTVNRRITEGDKFGSARFAREDELHTLRNQKGFYIGKGHLFEDKGHILTVAGTRGGKGTSIIIPNLVGAGNIQTSWVIIDPKAENAMITQRYQREIGQEVVILNPWGMFSETLGEGQSYNPLDMLDAASPHLVDDVQVIAEMIVPAEANSKNSFWSDSARSIVTGLLLHLVTSQPKEKRTLRTLWEWARFNGPDWEKLIQDMGVSDLPLNGPIIRNAANEILKMQEAGEETFGGIIGGVLQATDFLKSPALEKAMKSGYDPKNLVEGKTTLYVVIPADKLRSHARWLRLVVTSMMRAVIRQPKNRVAFLLDEFAALGYLPEIETALSTYAGYNVTVWPILQSLIQLQNLYEKNWETFIANCTVRQYFTINDNFSADYISKAIGETSHVLAKKDDLDVNKRMLVTPDELRRASGRNIFMFIGDLPPTYVEKLPYYLVPESNERADKNPYI